MATSKKDQLGEFELIAAIERLVRGTETRGSADLEVGIGDDAAVFRGRRNVVTTDCLVEGVHFERSWLSFQALGRRAARAALSDLAAMGAEPAFVFLSLALPATDFGRAALSLVRGFVADSALAGAQLAGGNVSSAAALMVTVTAIGRAPSRLATRDRARTGDLVFVTGAPGLAAAGLAELKRGRRSGQAVKRWVCPPLLTGLGVCLAGLRGFGAMIDVSDGLIQDLGHIAHASKCSVQLELDNLPIGTGLVRLAGGRSEACRWVCSGGEDYELAFTARPGSEALVRRACEEAGVAVTCIGKIGSGPARVIDGDGCVLSGLGSGHDHGRAQQKNRRRTKGAKR